MAVNRRRGRRSAVIASLAAAVALSAGLLTGCEVDDSPACLSHADDISDNITAIHEAGVDAIEDPTKTEESLDTIEKNLDKIHDGPDDSEVDQAVKDLGQAIEDYNRDLLNGDTPDSGQIDKAADKLRSVCTS
ncbi:hypothetical protein [Streptomyces aurantiogriseus]|uniref:Secreted protein n=1 Tax=Streptomyces aurantiogriseus TaxID=66870 RepID=A0A918CK09_9ACTN|nr:hypothetical protein [Streptomyces aurantiogriseus]GGR28072.1 hypothetical protein GCM10010251_50170 [Streptomyces aurantiogriseus]